MKNDIEISSALAISEREMEFLPIRAQGAGGQNVNKVSSAVHMRFDVRASNLPEPYKQRLLALRDSRISKSGVIVIKSQRHRTQEANRQEAIERLAEMIREAAKTRKARKPTRPRLSAKMKRVDTKTKRGQVKSLRGKVSW